MPGCSTFERAAEQQFNQKKAAEELARYRRKGPGLTTRLLQEGIVQSGAIRGTLLDVGSGVGSLTFGLVERGLTRAVAVDASSAYLGPRGRKPSAWVERTRFVSFTETSCPSRRSCPPPVLSPLTVWCAATRRMNHSWTQRSNSPSGVSRCRTRAACGTCGWE